MPLKVTRLRRWLAVTALLFTAVVAGTYFYARSRLRNVLKEVPNKIGIDIKQTASGFQFSKSEGGRTLFTIQASDLKQFKLNGRAELHNVSIVLYGRDSSRFDQISGEDFAYDPKSGDVTANGEVQIDLEANPAGLKSADQAVPRELKNPIHLKTRDLVFNRETGNASTAAAVEFRMPQASGSAVGMRYAAKSNTLTLSSQIHVLLTGPDAAIVDADRAVVTKDPRQVVVEKLRVQRGTDTLRADTATFFLDDDHNVDRVLATGEVLAETVMNGKASPSSRVHARADEGELLLADNEPQTGTLRGNVLVERSGVQPMLTRAGRMILDFSGPRRLEKIRATDGVHIVQGGAVLRTADPSASLGAGSRGRPSPRESAVQAGSSSPAGQDFDLTAPAVDFLLAGGRTLDRAVTLGAAQIVIASSGLGSGISSQAVPHSHQADAGQRTVITAGKFEAKFEASSEAGPKGRSRARSVSASEDHIRLSSIHGAPEAKIVSLNPGQPDRVSTSESVDATFLPHGGIESITQSGSVVYSDNETADKRTQAWAERARYTPADQMLVLSGNPRVAAGAMTTTAQTIRINRSSGDAFADGDVKSTYNELKEQPGGALLASSSPIHVTAKSMTAHSKPGGAVYSGNARLWQDANVIQAPTIAFDREHRSVTAQGTVAQPVSTILIPPASASSTPVENAASTPPENKVAKTSAGDPKRADSKAKSGQSGPVAITGMKFTYTDLERKAHYEGGVLAKGSAFTASASSVDAYLLPHTQSSGTQAVAGQGQLDRMVASGDVKIQQPGRRAEAQKLVYTAAEDKFVLTGGPPSIFDAERGKITGVSLTFYRRDDRVLVEGEASTPVVTQTRLPR